MNPFEVNPIKLDDCLMDWKTIYPAPYNKNEVDPYTRTRVILMNGTEFEANWFLHQFSRHETDGDVRRALALIRRSEQQQQKLISALKPPDETVLEHTIGYEQLAVDLTAGLAKRATDKHVKNALDFALLEDFDHLYRYADLLEMEAGVKAENLVGRYTEIMPGRPTIAEHRYPYDSIKPYIDNKTADIETKLGVCVITSAEQQTMNYYMNVCATYPNDRGRKLYQEIGMIEEEHVTQYGSLMDTRATWLESLLMHQYAECFLYYSCMETETCPSIKNVWSYLLEQEIAHLHKAAQLLKNGEGKEYQQVVGDGCFPAPLALESNIDYVRGVLASSVNLTAIRESYGDVQDLRPNVEFFRYQEKLNHDVNAVPSHFVIEDAIKQFGRDYRFETAPNPIQSLQNRTRDNTVLARTANEKVPSMTR